jgi:hypothetical protein
MSANYSVNRISKYAHEGKEMMDEYPISSIVISFGLGFAAGFAIVTLLSDSSQPRDQNVAHRLGSHLLEAMSSVLPDAVSRSFRG